MNSSFQNNIMRANRNGTGQPARAQNPQKAGMVCCFRSAHGWGDAEKELFSALIERGKL